MKIARSGIIFCVLFLISVLGFATSESKEKSNKKSSMAQRSPSNATTVSNGPAGNATAVGLGASGSNPTLVGSSGNVNSQNTPGTSGVTQAVDDKQNLLNSDNEKVEIINSVEESKNYKGVKKRGSSESPASLFEDEKGFLAGLDYPELQVVPRASDRLQMESQEEKNSIISSYWPIQVSSIALIMAGTMSSGKFKQTNPSDSQKKENQFATQMGTIVGAMWLGGTFYLSHSLSYSKSLPEIKKISGKDKKSLLLKERLSEEALERPAKIASMINTFSVWTNFFLALYINSHSKESIPSYTGFAMGLSFLPFLIDNRIVENWEKHQEYKRKIYAPITRVDFAIDPKSRQLTPLLGMQWNF